MKSFTYLRLGLFSFLLIATLFQGFSQNPAAYTQRQTDYINTALANFGRDAVTLQAFRGLPIDSASLYTSLSELRAREVSDFDIVKWIRVLYFTHGAYDTIILPTLNQIPFWLRKSDSLNCYWSENHMCMWMSSDWLLHEHYGRAIDSTLEKRLRHYLHLKVRYGFYEFFSSVYAPYCLSGLLNLADFAQDVEIKTLATQAAQRLLKDILMLTTDKGVFYPAAGRNYYGKYETAYGQNHNNLIWLLTGMGEVPGGASHAGGFLASSTLPVADVINSWKACLDTVYHIGHPLDTGFVLNRSMYYVDKIIFQWSSGAYFHPEVSYESAQLLRDSNLWNHVDFSPLRMLSSLPLQSIQSLTAQFPSISASSVICDENVAIFKHNSITLSSIQDFWKGKLGYQQMPCVAAIGTAAVLTAAGPVPSSWDNRGESNNNEHMPYVKQKRNVALLMYRPESKPAFLNYNNPEVALRLKDNEFDEVVYDSLWVIARQGENYIGVKRGCTGSVNGIWTCENPNRQSWVFIVGDSGMYNNFSHFQNIIHNSQFTENFYYDSVASQSVYYARIIIDTTTIEYAWGNDSSSTNSIKNKEASVGIRLFPNPANDFTHLDLKSFTNQPVSITVTNMFGQKIFSEEISSVSSPEKQISTANWAEGVYILRLDSRNQHFSAKLIKKE